MKHNHLAITQMSDLLLLSAMKLANYFIEKDKKIYSEKISNFYFLAFEPFFTDFFFAAIHLIKVLCAIYKPYYFS